MDSTSRQTLIMLRTLLSSALLALSVGASAQTVIDVWDTSDSDNPLLVAQIETIRSPESGAGHYDYTPASGEPACVNYGPRLSNIWIHENSSATDDLTFGFIFNTRGNNFLSRNQAELNFRILDSTSDPSVVQSDDPGEATETPPGSDAFVGIYSYNDFNTDGIAVGGLSGGVWTVIIDSVDFGNIEHWYAAGGGEAQAGSDICLDNLADFELTPGNEYRLTPEGNPPSGAPVDATVLAAVAGPDQLVEGDTFVTLDGSASSPLNQINYSWTQVGGPTVSLSDSTSPTPTFQAPNIPGTITFELVVTHQVTNDSSDPDTVNVEVFVIDSDGDGVTDDIDQCPNTPVGSIVNLFGCTGADEVALACPVDGDYRNHGAYVSCVAHAVEDAVLAGLLTEEEGEEIVSTAGQSEVGKKSKPDNASSKSKGK